MALTVAVGAGAATNNISTVAGTGGAAFAGDGGAAFAAKLNYPFGVSVTPDGGFLIADSLNQRVRRVSPGGTISTVAGNGTAGFSGDNGAATSARLNTPFAAVVTPDGGFLIADRANNRVRKVSPGGVISTVAGTGTGGFSGDGGPATLAQLKTPNGIAVTSDGGFLIADRENHRVRKVSSAGIISTVAGTGSAGISGDSGPAISAQVFFPSGVAATADGGFLIADQTNDRVREVSPSGIISTVAGNGTGGFSGDGGPATFAKLSDPAGVAATPDGGFLIADQLNERVRKVSAAGVISTVAGISLNGFSGDGGPATSARLASPTGVAVAADGDYLIADRFNHRVRRVDAGDLPPPPPPPPPGAAKPVFSKITLTPRRPRVRSARRAKLSFTLNVAARTTIRLDRILPGRRRGTRCVKPTPRNRMGRKCKRRVKVAVRKRDAKAATNTIKLGTLAGQKKLRRGRYRITLTATDARKRALAFKIRR